MNIISVEDPVEYELPGINQVQINEKVGLTFPFLLRSILRQDPNVIMIGEIRDMETAEIAQLLNGPEGFTPDSEFLLGPTSVRGFWVACAFCAHGLAGAGGIGKVMAEWIIDGHPEWDMWRLDVRRFGNQYGSQAFTLARTVETYGKYYDIHMPYEERESARPLRLSIALPREFQDSRILSAHRFPVIHSADQPGWEHLQSRLPNDIIGADHFPCSRIHHNDFPVAATIRIASLTLETSASKRRLSVSAFCCKSARSSTNRR